MGNSSDKYIIVPGCIEQIALKDSRRKEQKSSTH